MSVDQVDADTMIEMRVAMKRSIDFNQTGCACIDDLADEEVLAMVDAGYPGGAEGFTRDLAA